MWKRHASGTTHGSGSRSDRRKAKPGDRLELTLPGYKDGFRDGLQPGAEDTFKKTIEARSKQERIDWTERVEIERNDAARRLEFLQGQVADSEATVARTPKAEHPIGMCFVFAVLIVVAVIGEAALLRDSAEVFSITEPWAQWVFGVVLAVLFAFAFEVLHAKLGRWYSRALVVSLAVALPALAVLRVTNLQMQVVDTGNPWQRMLTEQWWIPAVCFLALSLALALAIALMLHALVTSSCAHTSARTLAKVRAARELADRGVTHSETRLRQIAERIDAIAAAKLTECLAGIAARRERGATLSLWERLKASPVLKFAPAVVLVGLAAFFLAGCSSEGPAHDHHSVLVIDESQSGPLADEDALEALRWHLSRSSRGTRIDILPVNAVAGDVLTIDVPKQRTAYDLDLEPVYVGAEQRLLEHLELWRKTGTSSDYQGTLRLAYQRLEGGGARTKSLVILGDMLDVSKRRRARAKPSITPDLDGVNFAGTAVYVGFIPGELSKLADREQQAYARHLRELFGQWGASDITVNAFGIQGLEAWAERTIGPPTRSFDKFHKKQERARRSAVAGE